MMDWGIMNAIGITQMAVFGLWILQREAAKAARKDKDQ